MNLRCIGRCLARSVAVAVVLVVAATEAAAQFSVTLTPHLPSPQPAGTLIGWAAEPIEPSIPLPTYQFSYRPVAGEWRLLRDFTGFWLFAWATLEEGDYEVRVIAHDPVSDEMVEAIQPYTITSRLSGLFPAVAATLNPLVALYSSPPCPNGVVWVGFKPATARAWTKTTTKPCTPGKSVNFYVAGMRANTTYLLQQQWLAGGRARSGPLLTFRTGNLAVPIEDFQVEVAPKASTSLIQGLLLSTYAVADHPAPIATDLAGNVVWYYDAGSEQQDGQVTRPIHGGTMLLTVTDTLFRGQILREIDLAGNVVRETWAPTVTAHLDEMGHDRLGSFHHEAIRLANGHTIVLGSVEREIVDEQGPGPVNVYGEMIVDLDEHFQPTWVWNGFDHLSTSRAAILGEICVSQGPGCPPLFEGETANDWLHANSIQYLPGDGSLIVSLRHQDWVVKIDYRDGTGPGTVLWRFGKEGDFTLLGGDPSEAWPWFSHQHDARMYGPFMVLYDNGNTRVEGPEGIGGNSRGQVWLLDEAARTATLVRNFDLGDYAFALGSAQLLANGNYHFLNGFLNDDDGPFGQSLEVRPDGSISFGFKTTGAVYRSFRMVDLYRP